MKCLKRLSEMLDFLFCGFSDFHKLLWLELQDIDLALTHGVGGCSKLEVDWISCNFRTDFRRWVEWVQSEELEVKRSEEVGI